MRLDPDQSAAVRAHGHAMISAGPGSGKTGVLSARAVELLKKCSDSEKVVAVSFTKDSATELRHRIVNLGGDAAKGRVLVSTFHGHCMRQLGDRLGSGPGQLRLLGPGEQGLMLKRAMDAGGFMGRFADANEILENAKSTIDDVHGDDEASVLVQQYDRILAATSSIDFSGLLIQSVRGMHAGTVRPVPCAYMLVDESQDMDEVQYAWIQAHAAAGTKVTIVGDDDQCHPPGVLVSTEAGRRAVESLSEGSSGLIGVQYGRDESAGKTRAPGGAKVTTYGRRGKFRVAASASRTYDGPLYAIATDLHSLMCTENHRCVVRWSDAAATGYALVACISNGRAYVGTCKLIVSPGALGVHKYLSRIGVETYWILGVEASRQAAKEVVASMAADHGVEVLRPKSLRGEAGDGSAFCRLKGLLQSVGQDVERPFGPANGEKRGFGRPFFVASPNVLVGVMEVLEEAADGSLVWAPVQSVRRHAYHGPVTSLEVAPRPLYIANGIVTHNSIYGWRHAMGYKGMMRFHREFKASHVVLQNNYRCAPEILDSAAKLIANNGERVEKKIRPQSTVKGLLRYSVCGDDGEEAKAITLAVQDEPDDWAVLARNNKALIFIEGELKAKQIPYYRMGGGSLWNTGVSGVLISVLKSLVSNEAAGAMMIAVYAGVPDEVIEGLAGDARESATTFIDRLHAALSHEHGSRAKTTIAIGDLKRVWGDWRDRVSEERTVSMIVLGVCKYLERFASSAETQLLHWCAVIFRNLKGTLRDRIRAATDDDKKKKEGVALLTMHGSKGLEFRRVWVLGCNDGIIPSTNGVVEEERRLFYVAMTRAKEELVLSYVLGKKENDAIAPSRFLVEAGLLHA